jgi:Ca2+-binding EF-hand superfamily protein
MLGKSVEDLMTEEQVVKILIETFKKFDADGSGKLEYPEFKAAFNSLGLTGSEHEIREMFAKVDADGSGFVDRTEFTNAIKDSRMAELSLDLIVSKMDGEIAGLDDIFADYKRKLESANKQSGIDLKVSEENFKKFQAQTRKRRILKKTREAKVAKLVRDLGVQLADMVGNPFMENAGEYKLYKTLEDTFNAFDKDGNAELGWKEYLEAWRFLDQPGTDSDVKRAFDAVDINGSGLVEMDEFMFSIMGEKANKYGGLADLERLTSLLKDLTGKYTLLEGGMGEMKEDADVRARNNH